MKEKEQANNKNTVLLHANQLVDLLTNKIEKLSNDYGNLEQVCQSEQLSSEDHLEYQRHRIQDSIRQEIIQAHTAGFIRASLHFFSEKYNQEKIKTINLTRVEEFVQVKMQNHAQIDCMYKAQEYMQKYINEFVQNYMEMRAQKEAEEELYDDLGADLGQERPELQMTNQFMRSTVDMYRFNHLRVLQDKIEIEQVKLELAKLIGLEEEERKMIAEERELMSKERELLVEEKGLRNEHKDLMAEEKGLVAKEKELLDKEKEEMAKRKGLLVKEKEEMSKEKEGLEKEKDLLVKEKEQMAKEREELERLITEAKSQEESHKVLAKSAKEEHELVLKALADTKRKQEERIQQVAAEDEYVKQVRLEFKLIDEECRQVFIGSKRKAPEEKPQSAAESDNIEIPSPKRHQKTRASSRKTESCLLSPESKRQSSLAISSNPEPCVLSPESEPSIEDLLQSKESHLALANMKVRTNHNQNQTIITNTYFCYCRNWCLNYLNN